MINTIYSSVIQYISPIGCKSVLCEDDKVCTYGLCLK